MQHRCSLDYIVKKSFGNNVRCSFPTEPICDMTRRNMTRRERLIERVCAFWIDDRLRIGQIEGQQQLIKPKEAGSMSGVSFILYHHHQEVSHSLWRKIENEENEMLISRICLMGSLS
jgi:hypothetical protein